MTDDVPATVQAVLAVTARIRLGDAPELDAIHERVARGVVWLVEHDPEGVYHLWFESGISPHAKMPSPSRPEVPGEYREYHKQRLLFEALWAKMERLEIIETAKAKEATT